MINKKELERIKLQLDVEEFVKKGGIIEPCNIGETSCDGLTLTKRQRMKMMNTTKLKEE